VAFSDPYGLKAEDCCLAEARDIAAGLDASGLPMLKVVGKVVAAGAAAYTAAKTATEALKDYKFVTYTRTNAATGQVYSGRTFGSGNPQALASGRAASHPERLAGFGPAVVDRVAPANADGYFASRGREQQLIDANGGAQSDGGTSANVIRGVSAGNPLGRTFHGASDAEFGPLSAYSGH
jgi:hypothetical protein